MSLRFTVPTLSESDSKKVIDELQKRLSELNDLALALKHAHWNVLGKNFIAVHEMLDPEIDKVRAGVDEIAERIATLGGEPLGTSEAILNDKNWSAYKLNRANTLDHIKALDAAYTETLTHLRESIDAIGEKDFVSSNILQDKVQSMELFQWFLRSHLFDE